MLAANANRIESCDTGAVTATEPPRLGIVVGHTHWDREWYLPFEGFRARLVAMMDNLLDYLEADPAFRCFVLDGQAIMVEDYLEVRPEAEPRIRQLAQSDRLKIGPWYTAVDTFLPDPESLVRNLILGRWSARRWGGAEMRVGHLPDTFGFIGQLPQLLQHFGIQDAFAWRGFHPIGSSAACWWQAPDGTRVLLMRPAEGYCEGELGVTDPERFLEEALPGILRYQDEEPYEDRLFVIGCDHTPASSRLPWLAEQIAERVGHPVEVGPLEEMAHRLRSAGVGERLPVINGEQRDPCLAVCPASISGTRIPQIKQTNQRVEALLLGVAEPLHALSELNGGGADRAHLRWAWRLLAQNHPHDSIPGCGTDAVNREIGVRFERAAAVAREAAESGALRLSITLDPSARGELGVIGILSLVGGRCRLRARLHAQPDRPFPRIRISTQDGHEVPCVSIGQGRERITYRRDQDRFANEGATEVTHLVCAREWLDQARSETNQWEMPFEDIELEYDAPRAGYTVLRIDQAPGRGPRAARPSTRAGAELANDEIRVALREDGLHLEDLRTQKSLGPVRFEHAGDSGDEYTANPLPEAPVTFWPRAQDAQLVEDAIGQHMRVPLRVEVPARVARERTRRIGRVTLDGELKIALSGRRADIRLRLINRARDFDLRLLAHLADATRAWSGVPFGVEARERELGHLTPNAPQQWIPDFPFRGWLGLQASDGNGAAVFARGLYEAAVRWPPTGGADIALTLLRGVGWLSRDDLASRPGDAGPQLQTPDAQCLGTHEWELALLPFEADEFETVPARSERFLRPAAVFPIQWMDGTAPPARSFGDGLDARAVISALRPADTFDGAMLHAHNPTGVELPADVSGQRARLDETPVQGASNRLRPFEIAAWRLQP
jgi:2-O-(6-phospho-alpha-D-mannosyl)-D-glycerate hydrolase